MHPILERLLRKRGLEVETLQGDEKATYDEWESKLTSQVTVETVKGFCKHQIALVEKQMGNLDNTAQKNERLVLLHVVYRNILNALEAPQTERETLEKYLTSLIESPI